MLWAERHAADDSASRLFLIGQNHTRFSDLTESSNATSAVLCTINILHALMPRPRLLQSMWLGDTSSIFYNCILFTSPDHLGNWQVTVTWKDKALKSRKRAHQKVENWLLSIRLHLKKIQKKKITNGTWFVSVFAFCLESRVMSSHFLLQSQGQGKKRS